MKALLKFDMVSKTLGKKPILKNLSFAVSAGEILVLLGPNGAGKSTTMNLATGLLTADCGTIQLNGFAVDETQSRTFLGYCPQDPQFPTDMRVREIFSLVQSHFSNKNSEVIDVFGLQKIWNQECQFLSGGQKRALSLALAFCGNAPVIILDEPTVGLDTEVRRQVWEYCRSYAKKENTILMTTHYLEEAEGLASRILLMKQGSILRDGSALEINREFGFTRILFHVKSESLAGSLPPGAVRIFQNQYKIDTREIRESLRQILDLQEIEIESVKPVPLEEVLLKLEKESVDLQ